MAGSGTKNQNTPSAAGSTFLPKQGSSSEEAKAERRRREGIRDALLAQAREKFGQETPPTTGYTQQLQQLETGVNDYLKRNPALNSRVVVLNPDEFDVAQALGIPSREAVRQMLKRQGVDAEAPMLAGLAGHMSYGFDTKFGISGTAQDAETELNVGAAKTSVIVPNSSHADPNPVAGFSYRDNIEFFNRHETWHVKDSWYDKNKFSRPAQALALEWNAEALSSNPEAREAFAMQLRKEALGDVGAIGDMIRESKKPISAIDNLVAYRKADPFDTLHLSSPVLEGMKRDIEVMGVEKFRRMSEKQVREFYHGTVEKYGMTGNAVKRALDIDALQDNGLRAKAASSPDPDTQKAVAFVKLKNADPAPEPSDIPLTPAQEKVKAELERYNPARLLEGKAFAAAGKITPETLVAAYSVLSEELRQKALKNPDSELYPLEMTKLQQGFVDMVRTTDYVAINRRHGYDIEKDLPEQLQSKFAVPAKVENPAIPEATASAGKKPAPKPVTQP
jgi:hypothetical protein